MRHEKYRFTRTTSVNGFFSKNTVSTDTLNALSSWRAKNSAWEYSVEKDTDEELIAILSVPEKDFTAAGIGLQDSCVDYGVERTHLESIDKKA